MKNKTFKECLKKAIDSLCFEEITSGHYTLSMKLKVEDDDKILIYHASLTDEK